MFPIAECFVAPQGEGTHTGRLMIFLRLAGCTVGTRYKKEEYAEHMFPIYTNECHLYDGRTFPCDTDYRMKDNMDEELLIALLNLTHPSCKTVCLTGGEPMMHGQKFIDLVDFLVFSGYKVHLETSGTIKITELLLNALRLCQHVSLSPKLGFRGDYLMCESVGDVKLLIDEHFDPVKLPATLNAAFIRGFHGVNTFLQPVNGEHTVNIDNVKRCLMYQLQHPHLKLSMQAHKLWGTR